MGFFKKLVKGIGKVTSFTSKVVGGFVKGGPVGAGVAFATNLKGGKGKGAAAQKATFSEKNPYANSLSASGSINTDSKKKQNWIMYAVGVVVAVVLGFVLFGKKRR